jgi:hypothetical protein
LSTEQWLKTSWIENLFEHPFNHFLGFDKGTQKSFPYWTFCIFANFKDDAILNFADENLAISNLPFC